MMDNLKLNNTLNNTMTASSADKILSTQSFSYEEEEE